MGLTDFLNSLQGKKVFFDPLQGNHGDSLLTLATQMLLRNARVTTVANAQLADLLLLNGGGSMVEGWSGLKRLAFYSEKFPEKPLAVLPSSFYRVESGLRSIAKTRKAPMWLWARESGSFEIVANADLDEHVTLSIDHDLAFFLDGHPDIAKLRRVSSEAQVLVVERDDWEGPTGRRRVFAPSGLEFIPEKIRTLVRRHLLAPIRNRQDKRSGFRKSAENFIRQQHPEAAGMTVHAADISLAESCDFAEFCHQIAISKFIVTTRLHVAILGQLLNRTTYLVDGNYHKFRGVYDFSMKAGSCRLVNWDSHRQKLKLIKRSN